MPQADLFYTNDLRIDANRLLAKVEAIIQTADEKAGACKGRAYPSHQAHHCSALLKVMVLRKAHRTPAFMEDLLSQLNDALRQEIKEQGNIGEIEIGILLDFAPETYVTGRVVL